MYDTELYFSYKGRPLLLLLFKETEQVFFFSLSFYLVTFF